MRYWLAIGGESSGPHTAEEISGMLRQNIIARDTPAMPEDGEDWTPLSSIPELSQLVTPTVKRVAALERHTAFGGAMTGPARTGPASPTRPVTVAQPSSTGPVVIIFSVIAVLGLGGWFFVHQHSQKRGKEIAAAEAKAEEQRLVAEEAAREAAEREANPAMELEGATREVIIAALKKAGMEVTEKPFTVNMSGTPTKDADIAMVGGLSDLEVLHLGSGEITDEGIAVLSGMDVLRELSVGRIVKPDAGEEDAPVQLGGGQMEVSDEALETLKKLKGLRKLHLWNCRISDGGFEALDDMQFLYDLELINTAITEAGARTFVEENPQVAVTVRSPGFLIKP